MAAFVALARVASLFFFLIPAAALADPDPPENDASSAAPFDYGYGPNVHVSDTQAGLWARAFGALGRRARTPYDTQAEIAATPAPAGAPTRYISGRFGPLLPWPIIPLHMALLPDGRVMSYGSDEAGAQTGLLFYDLWDPRAPYPQSHTVMPNTTGTDLFCTGLGLLPDGSLLLTGGDLTLQKQRNYSRADVNVFRPGANTLTRIGTMAFARWYPSDVPLANGDHVILGGRSSQAPSIPVMIPEYYSFGQNLFTPLPGAALPTSFNWNYPRAFVESGGSLLVIDPTGAMARLSLSASGGYEILTQKAARGVHPVPSVMYRPGQILSLRGLLSSDGVAAKYQFQNIDVTGAAPVVADLPSAYGAGRIWANMTVLADGAVFLNGGSGVDNQLTMVAYQSAIFHPDTRNWTRGPTNATPRLYHSAALLLPDATVLTGGGGAPGPTRQLNAEIYYPPYLFLKDGTARLAPRPVIASAPARVQAGANFQLTMADATPISAVNLVRLGAVTHSLAIHSRFIAAAFTQNGAALSVEAPANGNDFLPGYWMAFALDAAGTPSRAAIVYAPPSGAAPR